MIFTREIEYIKNQIIDKYHPVDIYLFGSYAKGFITKRSDIDLCIIIDTNNKRELVQDMLIEIDYESDLDIVIYTKEEWERHKNDKATFANVIYRTGGSIIGRH